MQVKHTDWVKRSAKERSARRVLRGLFGSPGEFRTPFMTPDST